MGHQWNAYFSGPARKTGEIFLALERTLGVLEYRPTGLVSRSISDDDVEDLPMRRTFDDERLLDVLNGWENGAHQFTGENKPTCAVSVRQGGGLLEMLAEFSSRDFARARRADPRGTYRLLAGLARAAEAPFAAGAYELWLESVSPETVFAALASNPNQPDFPCELGLVSNARSDATLLSELFAKGLRSRETVDGYLVLVSDHGKGS